MRVLLVGLLVALLAVPAAQAQGPLRATGHSVTCFLDVEGDGTRGTSDPVYLLVGPCGAGVRSGDVRLSPFAGFPGGSIVTGQHDDTGRTTAALAAQYAYSDDNGDGTYSASEPLFLHVGALPGPLLPGDLPLTGPDAFSSLRADDARVGHPVTAAPAAVGSETYAERDGLSGYTVGDYVLLDLDGNGLTTLGDLRLAVPTPAAESTTSGSPSAAPSPDPGPPASPPPGTPPSSPEAEAPSAEQDAPGSPGQGIPHPLAAGSALALLAIAAWARRLS